MRSVDLLIQRNVNLLFEGSAVIEKVPNALFGQSEGELGAGIGRHLRHCIDFYTCLLRDLSERRVDYDGRDRDPRLESDRAYSLARLRELTTRLQGLAGRVANVELWVRSDALDDGPWAQSTLTRELQILHSHTLHHYAAIGMILRQHGTETPTEFGLAPSTGRHLRSGALDSPLEEGQPLVDLRPRNRQSRREPDNVRTGRDDQQP